MHPDHICVHQATRKAFYDAVNPEIILQGQFTLPTSEIILLHHLQEDHALVGESNANYWKRSQ